MQKRVRGAWHSEALMTMKMSETPGTMSGEGTTTADALLNTTMAEAEEIRCTTIDGRTEAPG